MTFRVLALCGSLRTGSSNLELLKAAKKLKPNDMEVEIFEKIIDFPNYTPDLDFSNQLPKIIAEFRALIDDADALLIACPEYVHSLPGAFKNALDWLVSGEEFPNKPIAIFNAAPHSEYATEQLEEILRTMSGKLITDAKLEIPMRAVNLNANAICEHKLWSTEIKKKLATLKTAVTI